MSHTRRTARGLGALALVMVSATACASDTQWGRLGFPETTTEQGDRMLALWQGSWIAALAVGALVWGLIIWACVFHRKRSEKLPPQVRYNLPIEVLYTVVPIIIVAVLFYFTARDQNEITKPPSGNAPVKVKVDAFQWSWRFTTTYKGQTAQPVIGTPAEEAEKGPTLHLPTDTAVEFELEAPEQDVIHSFWVPAFLFKRDVIPGETDPRQKKFEIKTLNRSGTFAGRCAELCGALHSRMLFNVKLEPLNEFERTFETQLGAAQ